MNDDEQKLHPAYLSRDNSLSFLFEQQQVAVRLPETWFVLDGWSMSWRRCQSSHNPLAFIAALSSRFKFTSPRIRPGKDAKKCMKYTKYIYSKWLFSSVTDKEQHILMYSSWYNLYEWNFPAWAQRIPEIHDLFVYQKSSIRPLRKHYLKFWDKRMFSVINLRQSLPACSNIPTQHLMVFVGNLKLS